METTPCLNVNDIGKAIFLIAAGYAPLETPVITPDNKVLFVFGMDAMPYNRVFKSIKQYIFDAKDTRVLPTADDLMDKADTLWNDMETTFPEVHRL